MAGRARRVEDEPLARRRRTVRPGRRHGQKVLAVAEVEGLTPTGLLQGQALTQRGDRFALEGHPLAAGHPLHDAYIGRPDPLANQSQNSDTYGSLPEEGPLLTRPCACGSGQETARDFAQGHDMKAVQQRVREHFGGSVLALIRWIDSAHPRPAS